MSVPDRPAGRGVPERRAPVAGAACFCAFRGERCNWRTCQLNCLHRPADHSRSQGRARVRRRRVHQAAEQACTLGGWSVQVTSTRLAIVAVRGSASWWPVPRVQCFSMVLWKCGAGSSTIITFVPRSLRAPKCDTLMMLGLRQNSKLASSNHHADIPARPHQVKQIEK